MAQPPHLENDILQLVMKRLGFDEEELERIMNQPRKTWQEFPSYKKTFERLRPLFYVLVKAGRVPESFYVKFCFPAGHVGTPTMGGNSKSLGGKPSGAESDLVSESKVQ